MICISCGAVSVASIKNALDEGELVELRLDLIPEMTDEVWGLMKDKQVIATARKGTLNEGEQTQRLIKAIEGGVSFIDLDESDRLLEVEQAATQRGVKIIRSFHDFHETPSYLRLKEVMQTLTAFAPAVIKIATTCHRPEDALALLSILKESPSTVVAGMGAYGCLVRVLAVKAGSLWTYASADQQAATASGQITASTLRQLMSLVQR